MDLQKYLDEIGMSRYELAKKAGLSPSTILRICSGDVPIDKCAGSTLLRIAKALGISMEELLGEDAPIVPVKKIRGYDLSEIERAQREGPYMAADRGADWLKRYLDPKPEAEEEEIPDEDYETKEYILKLYDTELMRFYIEKSPYDRYRTRIISINEKLLHLFPLDLEKTDYGILEWLKKRVIPKNRAYVEDILAHFGLEPDDTQGIIDVCKGLSLNDSYWVVPADFDGRFSDYNLYQNRFSEMLGLLAYTGGYESENARHRVVTTSPELTTNGMLPKAWRFMKNQDIYLYKGGTSGFANSGNEPYSEFYACQIAERMGLNAVHYDLEKWKGILASKCKLFTDIDTAYVPIGRIVRSGGLEACLDYYETLGEVALEDIKSMIVFDAVVFNTDRHYGNFGVLRDNHSGEVFAAAPIFDNGISLFCYAMDSDFEDMDKLTGTLNAKTPYHTPYDQICRGVMGRRQKRQLRSLIDFRFQKHSKYNLPDYRLEIIENAIQKRVRELLED